MSKFRWLILSFTLALLLTGGVFLTTETPQTVRAEASVYARGVMAPAAPTLTLAIPDTALALDANATLDLAAYTTYSGTGTLTYTAETAPSDLFTLTLTGQMLAITSTSALTGGEFRVDVNVTDGVYTATDPFTVTVTAATELALDIADQTLALNGTKTLDLRMYTTYSGDPADLLYTATTPASALFAAGITGTHYLNITSTSTTDGGEFRVDVTVGDGVATTDDAFTVTVTSAPTLSLAIPAGPEGLGVPYYGHRTLNLWDHTTYYLNDKSGLIYTVTLLNGTSNFTVALANEHYLSMTAISGIDTSADVVVEVDDGDLYFSSEIVVTTDETPTLRFYGDYYRVAPNPLKVYFGKTNHLTYDGYETPQALESFIRGPYAEASHFELVGDVPPQLGAEIITGTENCSYEYCYFLTFNPPAGKPGTYQVEVQSWNYSYMTDTDVLSVTIMQQLFLPSIIVGFPPGVIMSPIENPDGDGVYQVQWKIVGGGYDGIEIEYATNPQFTGATKITSFNTVYSAETLTPGTYYWRARAYNSEQDFEWSNVVTVNVGNFAYLYIKPLCAYGLRVELFGPINASVEYESGWCGDTTYWRSVPAGAYTTRLTWIGASIVDNVPATYLGDGKEYLLTANPLSGWTEY